MRSRWESVPSVRCIRCDGRVLVDRSLCSKIHIELYCLRCGKRWTMRYPEKYGAFGTWIQKIEKVFLSQSSTAYSKHQNDEEKYSSMMNSTI